MNIDIDRVHDALEGRVFGRGCGRTTADLVNMATAVLVDDHKKYAYITNNETQADYAFNTFLEVCAALGMDNEIEHALQRRKLTFVNQCQIYFVSRQRLETSLRGVRLNNFYIEHYLVDQKIMRPKEFDFLKSRLY